MRRWKVYALAIVLFVLTSATVALVVLYRASQQVPDFYRDALVAKSEAMEVKSDEMIQRATSLHNAVITDGHWRGEFTAETINAWLAVDLPRNHEQSLPDGMSDPRVAIRQDELTIGCKISRGAVRGIVWIDLGISMVAADGAAAEDTPPVAKLAEHARANDELPARIALRIHKARLGDIPWPLASIINAISDAARLNEIRIDWQQDHGEPVALLSVPTKLLRHGQQVRLEAIRLTPGKIVIAGTTSKE